MSTLQTPSSLPTIPALFDTLDTLAQLVARDARDKNRVDYFAYIVGTTRRCAEDDSASTQRGLTLAMHWIHHFRLTLSHPRVYDLNAVHLQTAIGLMLKHKLAQALRADAGDSLSVALRIACQTSAMRISDIENTLACICIRALEHTEGNRSHPLYHLILALLTQWFGDKKDAFVKPGQYQVALCSPPALVDLLYGAGVWELYLADMGPGTTMTEYLFKLGLNVRSPRCVSLSVCHKTSFEVEQDMDMLPQDLV